MLLGGIFFGLSFLGGGWWQEFTSSTTLFDVWVLGGFLYYLLLFWSVGLFYIVLDHYQKPHWLFRYKIQSNSKIDTYEKQVKRLPKAIWVVLRNQFAGTLPALILVYAVLIETGYDWTLPIPSYGMILMQLGVLLLVEEVGFFTVHYVLHTKKLYATIHRIHHEYTESIGISTHYVHFLEHLAGNLFPILVGLVLFHIHIVVFTIWITFAIINAVHSHSGYNFPWMSYSVHHDYHHYRVRGNYGVLGILDRLFKTDVYFLELHRDYLRQTRSDRNPMSTPELAQSFDRNRTQTLPVVGDEPQRRT